MSIQLALLKSGEEVIADIKEIRQEETGVLVSYLFKDPYCVKIKTSQVLVEQETKPKHELAYYKCCLLYTSPSPRDGLLSRMPSSA